MEKRGVKTLNHIPDGWKRLTGAVNHPPGYRWIWNGKSRFGGEFEHALAPEEEVFARSRRR